MCEVEEVLLYDLCRKGEEDTKLSSAERREEREDMVSSHELALEFDLLRKLSVE